jgi:hypothetical protein
MQMYEEKKGNVRLKKKEEKCALYLQKVLNMSPKINKIIYIWTCQTCGQKLLGSPVSFTLS